MQSIQIENPRGFDPDLDMEPDMELGMKDPVDKQGCVIKIYIVRGEQVCLNIDSKFETTTVNLSKEKAIMVARMLYENAEKL